MNQPDYHIPQILYWLQPQNYFRGIGILLSHINLGFPVHIFNPHFSFRFPKIPTFNPLLFLWLIPIFIIWKIARLILRNKKSEDEKFVLLEITPPSYTDKTALSTSQLFSHLHGLGYFSKEDKLLGRAPTLSFEIVSTKTEGIRYLVRVKPEHVDNVKRSLLAY